MTRHALFCLFILWAGASHALELGPPGNPPPASEVSEAAAAYAVAIGPAGFDTPPEQLEIDGARLRKSWKLPLSNYSMAGLIASLEGQLAAQDHTVIYTCGAAECGGFDFRNSRAVLPLPAMFVDLGQFQYLSAEGINSLVEILLSQNAEYLYLQITLIGQGAAHTPKPETQSSDPTPTGTGVPPSFEAKHPAPSQRGTNLQQHLLEHGKVVLEGLVFSTGTTSVSTESRQDLDQLAQFLLDNPNRRVALVGHSDWTGTLVTNQRLSQLRATAVLQLLRQTYQVPTEQMEAHGIGFLSPLYSNDQDAGRLGNRRVEAVLLP